MPMPSWSGWPPRLDRRSSPASAASPGRCCRSSSGSMPRRLPESLARALALRPARRRPRTRSGLCPRAGGLAGDEWWRVTIVAWPPASSKPELEQLGSAPSPTARGLRRRADRRSARRVLAALALIDPRQAVELVEQLPDERGYPPLRGPGALRGRRTAVPPGRRPMAINSTNAIVALDARQGIMKPRRKESD